MRVGILTGGGDVPGLNAVIRASTKSLWKEGHQVIGIKNGWAGLLEKDCFEICAPNIRGILDMGGTILCSSRTNPLKIDNGIEALSDNMAALELSALIAIGGDDTLGVAHEFYKIGGNVVGVPKTVDNDLSSTDFTLGFDTAINTVTEALDKIRTTAESHHRTIVVEVMGRHSGWIAVMAGIAGSADFIVIPEVELGIYEITSAIKKRYDRGVTYAIVVVAEGAVLKGIDKLVTKGAHTDAFGHAQLGGIGELIAEQIKEKTGIDTRAVNLGHLQRGGTPTAFDRVLGTRLGVKAVQLILDGRFGHMAALSGKTIVEMSLAEAVGETHKVDPELYEVAKLFFG